MTEKLLVTFMNDRNNINLTQDMKKIMITFAWTVCVLTACDKNKPSQAGMQALPVDVAKM